MPRKFVDFAEGLIGPLSSESRFQQAAKDAGYGVQKTPDGGRMITKPAPGGGPSLDQIFAARQKSKIVPRNRPLTAAVRG